jgi:hypothetical protein
MMHDPGMIFEKLLTTYHLHVTHISFHTSSIMEHLTMRLVRLPHSLIITLLTHLRVPSKSCKLGKHTF